MSDIKDDRPQQEITADGVEVLEGDELDDVHGGVSIGNIRNLSVLSRPATRPMTRTVQQPDPEACCTVYGGTSGVINPLKR